MSTKQKLIVISLIICFGNYLSSASASPSGSVNHKAAAKLKTANKPVASDAASAKQPNYLGILLDNHKKIHRTVKNLPNGVVTITTSTDPKIAHAIQSHVIQMYGLMAQGKVIRPFDPLFAALFKYEKHIHHQLFFPRNGLKVIETSKNPYIVKLIQEHAHVVLDFVKRGYDALPDKHPIPPMTASEKRALTAKPKTTSPPHTHKSNGKHPANH